MKDKEKETLLLRASKYNITYFKVLMVILGIIVGYLMFSMTHMVGGGLDSIGEALALAVLFRLGIIAIIFTIPIFISGKSGIKYYEKKTKKLLPCFIWGSISLIVNLILTYMVFLMFSDSFSSQSVNGYNYSGLIILLLIVFAIFVFPSLRFLKGCLEEKFKISFNEIVEKHKKTLIIILGVLVLGFILFNLIDFVINNSNYIYVKDAELKTVKEFEDELISRGLVLENAYVSGCDISGMDSSYEYLKRINFDTDMNKKYPIYLYTCYASLIERSNNPSIYYSIDSDDWYISWVILYVNGQLYALTSDESELNSMWNTTLLSTKYSRIVSESDNITTYNWSKNRYSINGGIKNVAFGRGEHLITNMTDKNNKNGVPIIKVDRVDAQTLDRIAIELSPRYWIEYKKKYN